MYTKVFVLAGLLSAINCWATYGGIEGGSFEIEPRGRVTRDLSISSEDFSKEVGKKAYLEITARVQQGSASGFTPALRVFYNSEELKIASNRNASFRIGEGREVPSYEEGKGWTLPYGPSVAVIKNAGTEYTPEDPNLDVVTLLLPLEIEGGTERPSTVGEVAFEAASGEALLNYNIVVEDVSLKFLVESELPILQ